MAKKDKGSSKYLSPRNPQTGDGKTKRDIFDRVAAVFRTSDGKKIPQSVKPVKDQRGKKGKK